MQDPVQDSMLPGCWMIKFDKNSQKWADLTVFAWDPQGALLPFAPPSPRILADYAGEYLEISL